MTDQPEWKVPQEAGAAREIGHAVDLDDLTGRIIEATQRTLHAATAAIFVMQSHGSLRLVASHGYTEAEVHGFQYLHVDDPYPITEAVRSRQQIWLDSPEAWAARFPRLTLQAKRAQRSWAVLPLVAEGVTYGALGLGWVEPQHFDEVTTQLASELVAGAARVLARLTSVGAGARDAGAAGLGDEAYLRRIAHVMPGVLNVFDLEERRSVFVNRSISSVLGYQPEEVMAMGTDAVERLMHPEDRPAFDQHLARVQNLPDGEVIAFQHRMRDRDGVWRWFQSHDAVFARGPAGAPRELISIATEITDTKRVEQETARLVAIVEASEDAIFAQDLEGLITSWNPAAERMFGYRAHEIISAPTDALTSDWGEHDALRRSVLAGKPTSHVEAVRQARDGRRFSAATTITALKDRTGRVIGTSSVVRDVSIQRRSEATLRESAALFSSLIAQAPMGTYVVDGQFRLREVNEEARPVFASIEPLIGRDLEEVLAILWGPQVGGECAAIFRHTLETGERYVSPPFTEKRFDLGIDQTYEWETQRVTLPDGQYGVVCYFHEVTDRARAIEALRASEQRMRLATEATHVGIWQWNVQTNRITWDTEMFRIYGIRPTPDGVVDYTDWSGAVVPEDLLENEAILQDTVRRCGSSRRTFRIRRRDDGECRDVAAVETVRTNAQGVAEWVVGTNLDITERNRADAATRRLTSELAEADRRKDEFLAILAHELRNPLAPIQNGLQLLRERAGDGAQLRATLDKVVAMMQRQLGQMVHLVDDLLDVSRISRGKLELRRQRVELATVLESAVETSRPLVVAGRHELVVTLQAQPIALDADITRLAQVFANLINNAAKYSEPGGRIWLVVEQEGTDVLVRVRDTGIGISAELLPHVFEMFTQLDHADVRAKGGLGIGLSLVKRLVEMHGGTVEARSEGRGKGSEFVVRLPTAPLLAPAVTPAAPDPALASLRKRRVLVVDDNVDSADTMAMLLESLGNEVRTANDGAEAVTLASTFRPEVILMDIGMPRLDGYEACRLIRAEAWGQTTVMVALTGWGQAADKQRSREAGFDHHLVKPVSYAVVTRLLTSLPWRDHAG
jgi:PAS domain S-box-containing protein